MGTQLRRVAEEYLQDGDKITVAVTHEVAINRDKAWIRYEVTSVVLPDEGTEAAKYRVIQHVANGVIEAVEAAAEAVLEHEQPSQKVSRR